MRQSAIFKAAAGLVLAASLWIGVGALDADLRRAFRDAPRSVFAPEFRAQRDRVTQVVPPGESLLYLSETPEVWHSRLWQRALYPRNSVIEVQPPQSPARLRELRKRYGARFAISWGNPPFDPDYRWKVALGTLPGLAGETWFGELAP